LSPKPWHGRTARGLAALAGTTVLVIVVLWVVQAVEFYARHSCRWPASISCDEGSGLWALVPIGVSLASASGVVLLGIWTWTGRHGSLAWAHVVWTVGFPVAVVVTGPRQFGLSDLTILGAYASLAIELARRTLIDGAGVPRRLATSVAVGMLVVFVALLAQVPSELADVASRAGR